MKDKIPEFKTDEEAAAFLDRDLSGLDFDQFRPATFEFVSKSAQLKLRLPQPLLDAVKQRAQSKGIPFTQYIRQLMERDVAEAQGRNARGL